MVYPAVVCTRLNISKCEGTQKIITRNDTIKTNYLRYPPPTRDRPCRPREDGMLSLSSVVVVLVRSYDVLANGTTADEHMLPSCQHPQRPLCCALCTLHSSTIDHNADFSSFGVPLSILVIMASYIDFSKPSLWGKYKASSSPAASGCDD